MKKDSNIKTTFSSLMNFKDIWLNLLLRRLHSATNINEIKTFTLTL